MNNFLYRLENQVVLTKSILTEKKCATALKRGNLSPDDIRNISDLLLDCRDVIDQVDLFPDAGEA